MQPQTPYFMQHPGKAPKAPLSKKGRILLVAGGATVLLIVALVLMAIINSAGSAGRENLITAAQQQAELIRISKLGQDRARDTAAKNLAVTVNLSLQSDQTALLAELKKQGVKMDAKKLALGKKASTDTLLTNAEQSNKFDDVFIQTMQAQLKQYQQTLNTAYGSTDKAKLQTLLKQQYVNAQLLASSK